MGLKIDRGGSDRRPSRLTSRVSIPTEKVQDKGGAQFSSHMDRHFGNAQEEMLRQMAKEIEKQGERLAEHIDISELKVYKRMISEFLDHAVRGSSKFLKESFLDRRGRHRVYAIIKSINENLDILTQEVLKTEKNRLEILGRIEDIRGLILDLIL
ncbi:MAG TPA: YaaR family protein [Thermoclostridium sp.]|nr:YaaR family protein [Clostridiaceae bacterium]HOQ75954.1 YaaR family protein [Thermoclostridium sp.]